MAISNLYNSVAPATNPNAPKLPYQTGEPLHRDPPGMARSPIPGYRPEPPPLGFPLDGPSNFNKRGKATPPTPPVTNPQAQTRGSLRNYQLWRQSGHNTLDSHMYDYFGGDNILKEVQKFDPNAKWEEDEQGRRLTYDISKLPAAKGFENNREYQRAVYDSGAEYYRPDMIKDDENYGKVTDARNYKPPTDFLEKWGPVIGPALIGGVGAFMGGQLPALARMAMQGVGSLRGGFNPSSLISAGLGAVPGVGSVARHLPTLYNMTRRQ